MKVCIGIPIVGSVCGEAYPTHLEAVAEVMRLGHEVEIITSLDVMSYDAARNLIIVRAFMSDCDLLYFVDADTYLPPGAFGKLLEVYLMNGKPVLTSGHYLRRGYPYTSVWSKVVDGTYVGTTAMTGVHEIDATGLGCALIDLRWVDAHMDKPIFYQGRSDNGNWVPEDCFFCQEVKRLGGRILGVADVRAGHVYTRVVISDKTADWLRAMSLKQVIELRDGDVEVAGG